MPLLVEKPKLGSTPCTESVVQRQNLRADYRWISSEQKRLQKKYKNKYVAVKNQTVLLSDSNVYLLLEKLQAKGVKTDNIAVKFVSEYPTCFLL